MGKNVKREVAVRRRTLAGNNDNNNNNDTRATTATRHGGTDSRFLVFGLF